MKPASLAEIYVSYLGIHVNGYLVCRAEVPRGFSDNNVRVVHFI